MGSNTIGWLGKFRNNVAFLICLWPMFLPVRAADEAPILISKKNIQVVGNQISVDVVIATPPLSRVGFIDFVLVGSRGLYRRGEFRNELPFFELESQTANHGGVFYFKQLFDAAKFYSCGEVVMAFAVLNEELFEYDHPEATLSRSGILLSTITLPDEGDWRGEEPAILIGPDTIIADSIGDTAGLAIAIFQINGALIDVFKTPEVLVIDSTGASVPTTVSVLESKTIITNDGKVDYIQSFKLALDFRWLLQTQAEVQLAISASLVGGGAQIISKALSVSVEEAVLQSDTEPPVVGGQVTSSADSIRLAPGYGSRHSEEVKFTIPDVFDDESGVLHVTGQLHPSFQEGSTANSAAFILYPVADAVVVKRLTDSGEVTDYCLTFDIPNLQTAERPHGYRLNLTIIDRAGNVLELPVDPVAISSIEIVEVPARAFGVGDASVAKVNSVAITIADGIGQFSIETSDLNSSGVTSGQFDFVSPTGLDRVFVSIGSFSRVSGDSISGIYEGSFSIDPLDESGIWTLQSLRLRDVAGNELKLDSRFGDIFPEGVQTSFEVNNPGGDSARPELIEFEFDHSPIDVTNADVELPVRLRATDGGSGVERIAVQFQGAFGPSVTLTESNRTSGDTTDGIYEGVLTFPQNRPGIFVARVTVVDRAGHAHSYGAATGSFLGIPDLNLPEGSPEGIEATDASAPSIPQPPVVTGWTLASTELVLDGVFQRLSVTINAGDPNDAITFGSITFTSPDGYVAQGFSSFQRTSGDDQNGTYTFDTIFSSYAAPGDWAIEVIVDDGERNRVRYSAQNGNVPPNSPAILKVINNGLVDLHPPFPESVRLSPMVIAAGQETTLTADFRITDDVAGFSSAQWSVSSSVQGELANGILQDGDQISGNALDGTFQATIPVSAEDAVEGLLTLRLTGVPNISGNALTDASSLSATLPNPNHARITYDSRLWNPQGSILDTVTYPFPYDSGRVLVVEDADYALWAQTEFPEDTPASKRHPAVDLDHDNLTNMEEFQNGTNPAVSDQIQPPDEFRISGAGFVAATFQIQFEPYEEGATYTLRRFENLAGSNSIVENATLDVAGDIVTLTDPSPLSGQAFYHIERSQ